MAARPDGLSQMAFAGTWRTEEERVFALADEAGRGEVVDERPIHLLVEIEIKPVERAIPIAEAGLFVAAFKEPVLPPLQLVTDERGHEVEGRELLRLRVTQPGFEDVGHPREPEFAEGVIEFDEIHGRSPVLRSMRSR
jgi:hypothetical protein